MTEGGREEGQHVVLQKVSVPSAEGMKQDESYEVSVTFCNDVRKDHGLSQTFFFGTHRI